MGQVIDSRAVCLPVPQHTFSVNPLPCQLSRAERFEVTTVTINVPSFSNFRTNRPHLSWLESDLSVNDLVSRAKY